MSQPDPASFAAFWPKKDMAFCAAERSAVYGFEVLTGAQWLQQALAALPMVSPRGEQMAAGGLVHGV